MTYSEHAPAAALRDHVACYWSIHGTEVGSYRVLPDGCMDLLFDLGSGAGTLVGIMTVAQIQPAAARVDFFGIRFRPGEASAFVAHAAREIRDLDVDLGEVFGGEGRALAGRLAEAKSDPTRVKIADAWLLGRKLQARFAEPRVRAAVQAIEASAGAVSVRALAERTGLGERQLERAFHERVGVGPKALARAIRLQAFIAALDRRRDGSAARSVGRRGSASLAEIAAEAGFADESHLSREVRALTGLTPRALWLERMSDSYKSTA